MSIAHCNRPDLLISTALQTTVLLVLWLPAAAQPAPNARPTGGSVVGGVAAISQIGSNTRIDQFSQRAAINWQTFNINQGQTTTFNQPNSNSVALNRVIGGQGPSFLDGTLTANGRVFIINGDGILFGAHSSITTAGFLATTNDETSTANATMSTTGTTTRACRARRTRAARSSSTSGPRGRLVEPLSVEVGYALVGLVAVRVQGEAAERGHEMDPPDMGYTIQTMCRPQAFPGSRVTWATTP